MEDLDLKLIVSHDLLLVRLDDTVLGFVVAPLLLNLRCQLLNCRFVRFYRLFGSGVLLIKLHESVFLAILAALATIGPCRVLGLARVIVICLYV